MNKARKRHLILYSMYYFPEEIGIGVFNFGMAGFLKKHDYEVTVITAMPWYPDWKVFEKYKKMFFCSEIVDGVNVARSFVSPPRKVNAISRIFHEGLFVLTSSVNLLRFLFKRVDAIIVVCPPLAIGLPALFFSRLKRIPMIFHVQDLQVDAAKELRLLKNTFFLTILTNFEKFLFKHSTIVSTISEGMKSKIIEKGIKEDRVMLLPNWADTNFIKPADKNNSFRSRNSVSPESFLVLYAGNIGNKQGVEIILDVALISEHDENIQYFVVGDGVGSDAFKNIVTARRLKNVHLLPLQPSEELSTMLAAADVGLIIQKKSVGDFLMPSKLLNIMASSRPVIASANSTCSLSRQIQSISCGIVVEAENPTFLYNAIMELYLDREKAKIYGQNGRKFVENFLSQEAVLGKLNIKLTDLINNQGQHEVALC